jgi:hypothetical protein
LMDGSNDSFAVFRKIPNMIIQLSQGNPHGYIKFTYDSTTGFIGRQQFLLGNRTKIDKFAPANNEGTGTFITTLN